jgi:hypothetical protein
MSSSAAKRPCSSCSPRPVLRGPRSRSGRRLNSWNSRAGFAGRERIIGTRAGRRSRAIGFRHEPIWNELPTWVVMRPGAEICDYRGRRNVEPRTAKWNSAGALARPLLTARQRLKEDEDRAKYQGNTAGHSTDGVRGGLGVGNQIEEREAHDQEDDEPLDPRHVGLLILSVLIADYWKTCWVYRQKALVPFRARMSSE